MLIPSESIATEETPREEAIRSSTAALAAESKGLVDKGLSAHPKRRTARSGTGIASKMRFAPNR